MVQSVVRIDSFGWIDGQQFVEQVQRQMIFHVGAQSLSDLAPRSVRRTRIAVELRLQFVVQFQSLDARPLIWRQRTAQFADQP